MNNAILEKKIELSDEQIHVFLLQFSLFDGEDFLCYLSKDECERANRLKIKSKKKQFIVTRGALRKILSNSLSKAMEEIVFSYGEHNKPYIEALYNNKSIEFNISHSGDYALIALTLNNKVGVDIEKINSEIDYKSLSNRFFSRTEKEALSCLDEDKKLDGFYRAWVRKESFIKATGKGIAYGLDRFSVSMDKNKICKIDINSASFENKQWYCYDLMKVDDYKTALVSCDDKVNIIFHQ